MLYSLQRTLLILTVAVASILLLVAPTRATTISVDPARGSDRASGTRSNPLASVTEAWNRLPAVTRRRTTIELAPGNYRGRTPVYWEGHSGSARAPIVIRSRHRRGSRRARLPGVNIFGADHLEFRDLVFRDGGDVVHCEQCSNFTLRRVDAYGRDAQETVKINQSRKVRILDSRIGGADDNAIDFVAVASGLIRGNVVHRAGDWCGYAKGGSVGIVVKGNLFTRCGTGGFTAGQGTGFQFMTAPWLQYEAVGVVIRDNTITDTEGAAIGVQGGFNVLVENNVARRVGRRSHVLEALYGSRSCDGQPGDEGRERCAAYLASGGWGTTVVDDGTNYIRIGNRHVYFVGNVVLNPSPYKSQWQQLEVPGPFGAQPGSGVPADTSAASDLKFLGNVIWNGTSEMPIGADGCDDANPTCNPQQLVTDNNFNRRRPELRNRRGRLAKSGWVRSYRPFHAPAPDWSDLPAGSAPWRSWPR